MGKKTKIDYDDMERPSYNAYGRALQSYIGSIARSMVPINIKSWPDIPKNIKQKVWEEISNVFELAPQSESAVMSSAAQKWRDNKNKLTSRFIWPNKDNPEKLISPPSLYQLPIADWKAFVDVILNPSWEVTPEKQKQRTMHCRYHCRMSRKGYIGLEAELRDKKLIAEDEEIDRSVLWRKAREEKSGNITDVETSEVVEKIVNDDLLEKKIKGEFKYSGMNDVLTTALGSQERYGRVRGVGGFVKPQVFFKTPRKKRESVQKAMIENFKEQYDETKSLKAELEILKAHLATVIPFINDRTSEIVTSNNFSGMKDQKLSDYVEEVYECGTSNAKGKKCHLAVKQRENVVAYGTIISEGGPNVMIYHVPLGEENFKVSVDVVLDEKAELPIPVKSGPTIINDAVGAIVGWPKDWLFFSRQSHLYKYLREKDKADYISFVDPGNIPTYPIGTDDRHLSQHIADHLEAVCRDSICLIPYNTGYHWILTIVNEDKNMIYLLHSTSNRNRDDAWRTIVINGVKMYNASKGISKGPDVKY